MELWSIFDFIMPGYLYDKNKFAKIYEGPVISEKNEDRMEELSHIIRPFILRRLKSEVLLELPQKIESNSFCEMTMEQKKIYVAYYKKLKKELKDKLEEGSFERNKIELFAALTRLRQICVHPGTFIEGYEGGSGKIDAAMEIIRESLEGRHSVLVFSQFTKLLGILRNEIEKDNIRCYYLDGKMTPEERMMEIDNFNSDRESVFLISLKAGGSGLNLTKADIVIHFDPWWNPAVEDQASSRAHRMGQKNVVQVYKLLTEGTIEEKILSMQERKRDLIEGVIKPGERLISEFGEDEIRELFEI